MKCGDHFWGTQERLILFGSSKLCIIIIHVLRWNLRMRMPFSSLTALFQLALHPSFRGRKHTLNTGITWGCWASFCSLMDFTSSFLPDALASLALSLHPNAQQHWQSLAFNHFCISHYMTFPENILKYASNNAHSTRIWVFMTAAGYGDRVLTSSLTYVVSYFFHGYDKIIQISI